MFQYAMGRRLAEVHHSPLRLDLSYYNLPDSRRYALYHFRITAETAIPADLKKLHIPTGGRVRILKKIKLFGEAYIQERTLNMFDPSMYRLPDNIYLDGYWQSEKYFRDISDILRSEFQLKNPLSKQSKRIENEMRGVDSVSVHVRRGDYIKHGFDLMEPDYYVEGISQLALRTNKPHFFFFSDDLDWVRKNIRIDCPTTYVGHNGNGMEHEDLHLMSICKHHIIANSTFSWWGAWLGENPKKIIIAPKGYLTN